jgi:hypothetical protein
MIKTTKLVINGELPMIGPVGEPRNGAFAGNGSRAMARTLAIGA